MKPNVLCAFYAVIKGGAGFSLSVSQKYSFPPVDFATVVISFHYQSSLN